MIVVLNPRAAQLPRGFHVWRSCMPLNILNLPGLNVVDFRETALGTDLSTLLAEIDHWPTRP